MTIIVLRHEDDKYLIQATGHATGSEKVCSGVSAILYSIAGWLVNNGEHIRYYKSSLQSGNAVIEFAGGVVAKAVYEVASIGLLQIEKQYPDYIQVRTAK